MYSIKQKLDISVATLAGLLLIALVIGLVAAVRLTGLLGYITGPAWNTADGAMEGNIGLQSQMIALEEIYYAGFTPERNRHLQEGKILADEALGRMADAGLLENSDVQDLNRMLDDFHQQGTLLFENSQIYQETNKRFIDHFHNFKNLMTEAEELGDSQVEFLESNPNQSLSWNNGLSSRWAAADGGMESQIYLLSSEYYFTRYITQGQDPDDRIKGLEALLLLEETLADIKGLRVFNATEVKYSAYRGQTFSDAFEDSFNQLKSLVNLRLEHFDQLSRARLQYINSVENLTALIEDVEESADARIEGQLGAVQSAKALVYTLFAIIFGAGLFGAVFIFRFARRQIIAPLLELTESMQLAAGGELTLKHDHSSRTDEVGAMAKALKTFVDFVKQGNKLAEENERISGALSVADTPVMLADNNLNITYLNKAAQSMMNHRGETLKTALPNLDYAHLVGVNVDGFHKNPSHQRGLLANLTAVHRSQINVAGLTFGLTATPLFNSSGERLGTVIEWEDRTERLAEDARLAQIALENSTIRGALDVADTPVMVANTNLDITYINQSAVNLMKHRGETLRQALPNLDYNNLLGANVDQFHKDPSHQRRLLGGLTETYNSQIVVAGLTFGLTATPLFNAEGEHLGTVIEWEDRTERLAEQNRLAAIAQENARIKQALDNVQTNTMIADAGRNIVYINKSVHAMLKRNEEGLRKALPHFNADDLVGKKIDIFHKNPAHQEQLLENMVRAHNTQIQVNDMYFGLVANPVYDDEGQRIGTVVEWNDRTQEVNIEKEIDLLIQAAAHGDLTQRISTDGKEGFFEALCNGLNNLVSISEGVVQDTARIFSALSHGNLTESITKQYEGAFGELKKDANATVAKLTEIITQIREASNTVTTGADEIAQGNADLSQRTEEQASSLEETASSMEEMTSAVKSSADNAQEANEIARQTQKLASEGGEVVRQAVLAMGEINESSKQIADIIGVIDEIAFQTNLLALNAAVEAARAGEQGRGFAVVASEVRNLAQRSAGAAKEIKDLIRDSVDKVSSGSELVNKSGSTLEDIVKSVAKVSSMVEDISSSAFEQSNGIEQVNKAVSQMDEMTQQNAALVEQATAAGEAMAEQARKLAQQMAFFTLGADSTGSMSSYSAPAPATNYSKPAASAASKAPLSSQSQGGMQVSDDDSDWEEF